TGLESILLAGWLKMERDRIVDAGQNAALGKQIAYAIAVWHLDDIHIKGMLRPWRGRRRRSDNIAQFLGVGRRMFPPRLIPAIQMWEFDPQNRRLYLIHA